MDTKKMYQGEALQEQGDKEGATMGRDFFLPILVMALGLAAVFGLMIYRHSSSGPTTFERARWEAIEKRDAARRAGSGMSAPISVGNPNQSGVEVLRFDEVVVVVPVPR